MTYQDTAVIEFAQAGIAPAPHNYREASEESAAADRERLPRQSSAPRMDQPCRPQGTGDDTVARLLQHALTVAQLADDLPSQRVIDHLRLAIAAFGDGHLRPLAPVPPRAAEGLAAWQAARAQKLILERLDAQILTATLAKACSLSRGHFSRLFKKTFGLPPHKWQRERRLEMAKTLLCDPNCALADIAIRCGFNDQAHFTRVFKLTTRVTPMVWRRERAGEAT